MNAPTPPSAPWPTSSSGQGGESDWSEPSIRYADPSRRSATSGQGVGSAGRADFPSDTASYEAPGSAYPSEGAGYSAAAGRTSVYQDAATRAPATTPTKGHRAGEPDDSWTAATHRSRVDDRSARTPAATKEWGLPGWLAVLVLIGISAIGGAVDLASGSTVKGGFNIALVVASVIAIIAVRRNAMFPVVVAPPLVYMAASAAVLIIRSHGFSRRSVFIDAASSWLVYGFPAIAGASAAVLIIAGIRMIINK